MNNQSEPTILAIETSCDETSAAVVRGTQMLSNVIYSQLDLHAKYGGVVPSIARTAHQEKLPGIVEQAVEQSGIEFDSIDYVAVTQGPGLAIALEVGISHAKELATKLGVPVIGINHMEGHLVSVLNEVDQLQINFPVLGLLISGGHTEFILVKELGSYQKVATTLDDACGEAFDKAAVMLGLGYPGGPAISKAAAVARDRMSIVVEKDQQSTLVRASVENDTERKYELPIPMLNSGDLNMSYSGLKTAVKHLINSLSGNSDLRNIRQTAESGELTQEQVEEISVVFEEAATEQIARKLKSAIKKYPETKEVWMGGGVVANKTLRAKINSIVSDRNLELRLPADNVLAADNAGMIGIAAALKVQRSDWKDGQDMDRKPGLSF